MKAILIILAVIISTINAQAQMAYYDPNGQNMSTDYSIELAIEYDGKLLMDWGFSREQLTLGMGMYGDLSLKMLDATERLTSFDDLKFSIAIQDTLTGTMRMFSDKTYNSINVEDIVKRCKEGEKLIIMTTDRKYILRQNEIELMLGC